MSAIFEPGTRVRTTRNGYNEDMYNAILRILSPNVQFSVHHYSGPMKNRVFLLVEKFL